MLKKFDEVVFPQVIKSVYKNDGVYISMVQLYSNKFYTCWHTQPLEQLLPTFEPSKGVPLSYAAANKNFNRMVRTKMNFERVQ